MRVRLLTSKVHAGLETLPYTTCRTVFPSDLVNDTVISPGTQVVVLTCGKTRHSVGESHMKPDLEQGRYFQSDGQKRLFSFIYRLIKRKIKEADDNIPHMFALI